jgi:hypothetical protein
MVTGSLNRRLFSFCAGLVILAAIVLIGLPVAHADDPVGMLTVVGMVKVNGKPAATGDIVTSGSPVETAARSSAVVSLGKLGRVEVMPDSKIDLRYDSNITIVVAKGSVRVATGPGVSATVVRAEP